jgi:tRNA pseudouridine38-40 synthase
MVRNIKLLIAYDGTAYHGWQSQLNKPTIQETIEKALYTVMKQKINLTGSGRTDAGVHALGQVANFKADTRIPDGCFLQELPC